ncbi:hypothetical protein P691DRAFT_811524 [Macrolepiota fuliginosa MF-IS2]|uniref:Uncharacterized protein n=1 Tax=Macrolepiota fuliginosa MF-IS2 TaxID=1400762 RepID=A0A9P5X0Y8_9AGAR|nr:hypothetical protein P691DRAFT_811524 [Macrolepiota fuliginosa MF-IS2]
MIQLCHQLRPKSFQKDSQPRLSSSGARGRLEPYVTNLPRHLSRAQKERERVRQRCLQEVITGSGGLPSIQVMKDWDWMWQDIFGFTGVVRVRVRMNHGECRVTKNGDNKEELGLVIGQEEAKSYDDIGISTLTDSQFESATAFLVDHRRRNGGKGKILTTVPPWRLVEAISIALFALSLPSTSSPSLIPYHALTSPSCDSYPELLTSNKAKKSISALTSPLTTPSLTTSQR